MIVLPVDRCYNNSQAWRFRTLVVAVELIFLREFLGKRRRSSDGRKRVELHDYRTLVRGAHAVL